jgi:hypothetical protein
VNKSLYTVIVNRYNMQINGVEFELAELAFDVDASKILALTYTNSIGVREMSEALEIPQGTCYRRV